MESFSERLFSYRPLTIFGRISILNFRLGSEHASQTGCLSSGFVKNTAIYCKGKNRAIPKAMKTNRLTFFLVSIIFNKGYHITYHEAYKI